MTSGRLTSLWLSPSQSQKDGPPLLTWTSLSLLCGLWHWVLLDNFFSHGVLVYFICHLGSGELQASAKQSAKTSPQMDLPTGALCPGYHPDSGSPGTGHLAGDRGCPFPSDPSQSVGDILSRWILEREEVRG